MLSLLNHQLYQSTPAEKYATLFLGIYDGHERKLTYSNGGHLPPIILGEDGRCAGWSREARWSAYSTVEVMRNRRSLCDGENFFWRTATA